MGLDAQKSFAEMYEDWNVNKGIGGQVMELDPITQEPRKEKWTRKPQSPFQIRCKSNNFPHIFIRMIFAQGRTPLDNRSGNQKTTETKVYRSDLERLLLFHPFSWAGSAATPFPLLDFLGAIRKSTERFTCIHWGKPRSGVGKQGEARILDLGAWGWEQI